MSIDLESWVHYYDDALKEQRYSLSSDERKIADNNYVPDATAYIMDILDKYKQKATFFITAELYDWYPYVIEEVEKRGHEIGYHTHTHKILHNKEILEEELKESENFLQRFKPEGFRAPQIFITRESFACLKEYGFKYSSSTYWTYKITNIDGIDEIPVSAFCYRGDCENDQKLPKCLSFKLLTRQIPFGSGLFISLFGSKISYFIDSLNRKNVPAILFIHPWQLYRHSHISTFNFKIKLFSRNPLCLPYTLNVQKTMENLFQRYSFLSFRRYYEK
jgi:hypothetical protein